MANSLSRRPSRRPLASRVKFSDFYELLGPLGAGAFAQVFRGKDLQTGRLVAVKIISKDGNSPSLVEKEIQALIQARHEHIVTMYQALQDDDNFYIILEYCPNGDLKRYLQKHELVTLPDRDSASVIRIIAGAIAFLHSHDMTHRDVKLANILVRCARPTVTSIRTDSTLVLTETAEDVSRPQSMIQIEDLPLVSAEQREHSIVHTAERVGGWDVCLTDFGLSTKHTRSDRMNTVCGTPVYTAPEVCENWARYSPLCDVWSLGVVTFVLLTGKFPFRTSSSFEQHAHVVRNWDFAQIEDSVAYLDQRAIDLLRSMLQVDPAWRITAAEIMEHPWITNRDETANLSVLALMKEFHLQEATREEEQEGHGAQGEQEEEDSGTQLTPQARPPVYHHGDEDLSPSPVTRRPASFRHREVPSVRNLLRKTASKHDFRVSHRQQSPGSPLLRSSSRASHRILPSPSPTLHQRHATDDREREREKTSVSVSSLANRRAARRRLTSTLRRTSLSPPKPGSKQPPGLQSHSGESFSASASPKIKPRRRSHSGSIHTTQATHELPVTFTTRRRTTAGDVEESGHRGEREGDKANKTVKESERDREIDRSRQLHVSDDQRVSRDIHQVARLGLASRSRLYKGRPSTATSALFDV